MVIKKFRKPRKFNSHVRERICAKDREQFSETVFKKGESERDRKIAEMYY